MGQTPLIKFASCLTILSVPTEGENSRIVTMKMLLEAGSDMNARNNYGATALHVLVRLRVDPFGNGLEVAKLLLSRGIDPTLLNADGQTAAQLVHSSSRFAELRDVFRNATIYWLNAHTEME